MTIPWGPLACLGAAIVLALAYKRFAPATAQKMTSPIWWLFLVLTVTIFGSLAVSLAQT